MKNLKVQSILSLAFAAILIASDLSGVCGATGEAKIEKPTSEVKVEQPAADLDKMNFNVVDSGAVGTGEAIVNPETVIARVGSDEIKMKTFMEKLEDYPPQMRPQKPEDKMKFVERLVDEKMIELDMKDKKFTEGDKFADMKKILGNRVMLMSYLNDEFQKDSFVPSDKEVNDFFEKNKETNLKGATLDQVKPMIVQSLKSEHAEKKFEELFKKLAKENELKTDETVLAKVKDLNKLESKELEMVLFKSKSGDITLMDMKKMIDLEKTLSPGRPPVDLGDTATCQIMTDNLLRSSLWSKYAFENGYDPEKNPKVREETKKMLDTQAKRMFIEKVVLSASAVSEEDKKKYYDEHKEEFSDASVKASHILVDSEEKAKDIEKRLKEKDGKNFEEIAKAESKCPSAAQGGDLGFFDHGKMVKEFEEAAFKLEVGKISPIVKTKFGYHIIKVTEKKGGKQFEYKDSAEKIAKTLEISKKQEIIEKYRKELRAKYNVEIFNDRIK